MSKKFEIPEALRGKDLANENHTAIPRAADKHGKQLSKAESDLFVVHDLLATLRSFLCDDDQDPEIDVCYTADTVVELIQKRVEKARRLLSIHSRRHTNLFTAYFDLKAEGGAK